MGAYVAAPGAGQFAGSSGAGDSRRKQVNVVEPGHKPKPTSKKKVPQHADLVRG